MDWRMLLRLRGGDRRFIMKILVAVMSTLVLINICSVHYPGKSSFFFDDEDHHHPEPKINNPSNSPVAVSNDWDEFFSALPLDSNASFTINPALRGSEAYFVPGAQWLDSDGEIIQAHGGGILYVPETATFYWYGEHKGGPTYVPPGGYARTDVIGVSCYSSKDLWEWKNEGIVLKAEKSNSSSDLYVKNVLERPKVIYNDKTGQYVMWMHIDNADYSKAALGVAVGSRPEGPFEYLGNQRHHNFDSRDMTIFKDDDGTAYVVYSSDSNTELHITPLEDDYLSLKNTGNDMSRQFVGDRREAPAVFKHKGVYYMVTSGCTGWDPNKALYHAAESMMGEWQTFDNPCVGGAEELRAKTFLSQGTFVLPLPGLSDVFIFMADRWNSADLGNSRYVWLPLTVGGIMDQPVRQEFQFPLYPRVDIRWYSMWMLPVSWDKAF